MLCPDRACKYATRGANREEKSEDHQNVGRERLGEFPGVPKQESYDLQPVLDQTSQNILSGSRKLTVSFDSKVSGKIVRFAPVWPTCGVDRG